jgi:hypothetical protein
MMISNLKPGTKNGDLLAWWVSLRVNESLTTKTKLVNTPEEAIIQFNKWASPELEDDGVTMNTCGLVEWDGTEWSEWYNDDGEDVRDYELRMADEPDEPPNINER